MGLSGAFPVFFVAVVAEEDAVETAIRAFLKDEAAGASVGIEEGGRGFGEDLGEVAGAVFDHEAVAVAEDGDLTDALVEVVAFKRVVELRIDVGGRGMQWDEDAGGFGLEGLDVVETVGEEPLRKRGVGVGLVPGIVVPAFVFPEADVTSGGGEGLVHDF